MILVLDNLRSALNVGSIIRTCDALGISEIYFCGITPGPENLKVTKTSLGAETNIKGHIGGQTLEVVKTFVKEGKMVVALELTETAGPLGALKSTSNLVLVVGNEVSGVSSDVLALCSEAVMIPMKGVKESLNVSVAFGIAAFEILNSKKDL